jgi:pimeloyl-ACP methyl ester carboxylesterase
MGLRSDNLARLLDILDRDATIDVIGLDLGAALAIDRYVEHPELAAAMADTLVSFAQRSSKPFAVVADAPHRPTDAARLRDDLRARGVLTFVSPQRAAHALHAAVEYWRVRAGVE